MSPCLSRISVLEQVPLFEGGGARRTLEDLVRLGRGLEESGYHRLWLSTTALDPSCPPRPTCS